MVFTGLCYSKNENCEEKLRCFIYEELGLEYNIQLGNVHRFGKIGRNGAKPIVARFIYRKEFDAVLKNAYRLKGKPFGISEQFPYEIERRRKELYPIMKTAKGEGKHTKMVRDKLFIDGEEYISINENPATSSQTEYRDAVMTPPNQSTNSRRPYKRARAGSSPNDSRSWTHL